MRTVFNILGPLLNPASCAYFLIGVYSEELVPLMGEALHNLGVEMAMVVHCGGLDELAPIAVATIATVPVPHSRPSTRFARALSQPDPVPTPYAELTCVPIPAGHPDTQPCIAPQPQHT